MDNQPLIDQIYEAAIFPDRWKDVLERLAGLTDSAFGCLFTMHNGEPSFCGTPEGEALIQRYTSLPAPIPNSRVERTSRFKYHGFKSDLDLFSLEELQKDVFYRDFLWPAGYGWMAATAIDLPGGDRQIFNVERRRERGPYERAYVDFLDQIRPDLARSILLTSRLDLQRARAATATLRAVGLPAAILGKGGRVMAANDLFESFVPHRLRDGRVRLQLAEPRADKLLSELLARQDINRWKGSVASIPIRATDEGEPALVVHCIPVKRDARDIFVSASMLVVVNVIEARAAPDVDLVEVLFDLTPAEARVARAVAGRQNVPEIAAEFGVSQETVRSQLKSAFAKTGSRNQVDLAALLQSVLRPPQG